MHAIGWEVRRRDPAAKVVYITAEKFMLQFMAALRHQDTIAFKERFRSVDMLLIDDIQFFAGKESTQSEFFHTINTLIGDGRKLLISADRSIYDIEGIEERVRSRLQWGLVAAINPADYELRLNILQARVEQTTDVSVPRDVVEFLARRITSNVRELEGALNRIVGHALLLGKPIDLAFARQVLSDVLRAFDRA
nr:DnaA/Hda family protein [Hankyongella ginsenosidimutans]